MASFYKAPTANFKSTTLDGAITDSDTTISLTSASGFQAPGVIIVNREDGDGTATPNSREIIHYTGINSNDLTGCTRGEENSTARSHADGSLVEAVFTVEMWGDLRDAVAAALSTDGSDLAITGTASIATLDLDTFLTHPRLAITSVASVARGEVTVLENTQQAVTSVASIAEIRYGVSKPAWNTESDGATITFDMNVSNVHKVTLGGNRTLAVSNVEAGQAFIITLIQDGTGSRTVTWFSDVNWDNNTTPTLTTTAGRADVFGFLALDSNDFYGFTLGQNHPT